MIRRGQEGHILFHNAYTEANVPDVILQPYYHIIGWLSRPLALSPIYVYLIAHLVSLAVFLACVFFLIDVFCPKTVTKILAALFFFSATGYWYLVSQGGSLLYTQDVVYSYYFDLLDKFLVIPPHHLLALSLSIIAIILLARRRGTLVISGIAGILFALVGFLHPWMQAIFLACVTVVMFIQLLMERNRARFILQSWIIIMALSVPVLLITLRSLPKTDAVLGLFVVQPRTISFLQYVTALGPLFIPAVFVLFFRRLLAKNLILCAWAFVPIALFFLPDARMPMDIFRLFQIYQHIPMAILAALALEEITKKLRLPSLVLLGIGILFGIYGYTSFTWMLKDNMAVNTNFYNYYIPKWFLTMAAYLDRTAPDSVVLAGTTVSSMIPAFTHNKVILGHDGNQIHYAQKRDEAYSFFYQTMPTGDIKEYIRGSRANYIVLGVDIPGWSDLPYASLPFFTTVYTDSPVSVVRVGLP